MIKMNAVQAKEKELKDIVQLVSASDISSIKSVVSNILSIINNPKSTAKDLKDIIEIDPPLTAKILKIANSAYYSRREKISEIRSAIIWIGFETLKEIALSQKVCEVFNKDEDIEGYSRISLWKHSVCVALLGKMIFRKALGERGENVYAAGLLHDIGIIAEDQFLQDDFKRILNKSKHEKKNLSQSEYEILGYDHAAIGRAVADVWNFPRELVEAIGSHHHPSEASQEHLKIASTLFIADYLCHERDIGYCGSPFIDKNIFQECLKTLDVKLYALDLIMSDFEKELNKMQDQELL